MRGLIELEICRALEAEIGRPLGDVFDLIGGTSIGGAGAVAITLTASTSKVGVNYAELLMLRLREIFALGRVIDTGRLGLGLFE